METAGEKPVLRVINGGKPRPGARAQDGEARRRRAETWVYADGYITDTRLMGVCVAHAEWVLPEEEGGPSTLHQYFYLDAEDGEMEVYNVSGDSEASEERKELEAKLTSGLGGKKKRISERRLSASLQEYYELLLRKGSDLPKMDGFCERLLFPQEPPTAGERYDALKYASCEIENAYSAINYFLMRLLAKDMGGIAILARHGIEFRDPGIPEATLAKNNIDEAGAGRVPLANGKIKKYICESIAECDDCYYHLVSHIDVDGESLKIEGYELVSKMEISMDEAAMQLGRSEFVSVFDVEGMPPDFQKAMLYMSNGYEPVEYDGGMLYMRYRESNDFVGSSRFMLSDDTEGASFLTFYGQLVLVSSSREGIGKMEELLLKSGLAVFCDVCGRYEFKDQVFSDFIQGDFESFDEFLDYIRG